MRAKSTRKSMEQPLITMEHMNTEFAILFALMHMKTNWLGLMKTYGWSEHLAKSVSAYIVGLMAVDFDMSDVDEEFDTEEFLGRILPHLNNSRHTWCKECGTLKFKLRKKYRLLDEMSECPVHGKGE